MDSFISESGMGSPNAAPMNQRNMPADRSQLSRQNAPQGGERLSDNSSRISNIHSIPIKIEKDQGNAATSGLRLLSRNKSTDHQRPEDDVSTIYPVRDNFGSEQDSISIYFARSK